MLTGGLGAGPVARRMGSPSVISVPKPTIVGPYPTVCTTYQWNSYWNLVGLISCFTFRHIFFGGSDHLSLRCLQRRWQIDLVYRSGIPFISATRYSPRDLETWVCLKIRYPPIDGSPLFSLLKKVSQDLRDGGDCFWWECTFSYKVSNSVFAGYPRLAISAVCFGKQFSLCHVCGSVCAMFAWSKTWEFCSGNPVFGTLAKYHPDFMNTVTILPSGKLT